MREIQNACNAAQWPLDFMTIVFMGGTANVTMDIIHEVFGNGVEIVKESKFANALGFLKGCMAHTTKESHRFQLQRIRSNLLQKGSRRIGRNKRMQ